MNQNIKAAAIAYSATDPLHFRSGVISDFTAGAEFFQQSSGADEISKALQGILEIGKRDMSNPKYDGYFDEASFILTNYKNEVK